MDIALLVKVFHEILSFRRGVLSVKRLFAESVEDWRSQHDNEMRRILNLAPRSASLHFFEIAAE